MTFAVAGHTPLPERVTLFGQDGVGDVNVVLGCKQSVRLPPGLLVIGGPVDLEQAVIVCCRNLSRVSVGLALDDRPGVLQ